jgi:hypothetical protein
MLEPDVQTVQPIVDSSGRVKELAYFKLLQRRRPSTPLSRPDSPSSPTAWHARTAAGLAFPVASTTLTRLQAALMADTVSLEIWDDELRRVLHGSDT